MYFNLRNGSKSSRVHSHMSARRNPMLGSEVAVWSQEASLLSGLVGKALIFSSGRDNKSISAFLAGGNNTDSVRNTWDGKLSKRDHLNGKKDIFQIRRYRDRGLIIH